MAQALVRRLDDAQFKVKMSRDAAVTALRRVGDVPEPAAVGAWLRMIVRNGCRSLLRGPVAVRPMDRLPLPSVESGPERWPCGTSLRDQHRERRAGDDRGGPAGITRIR
ncbi:hypothetical protein GCM10010219_14210 [Streptomyces netropsis]|nr:hypothetical protein GCM10010219_14210 [Streptomyces netropsis]